ncbi:17.8 kDa class I heat shock protein [Spatholobus suberectus]|nr:17.8 kDa class I heat shock protein [Spatholobus suberectus]
MSIFEPPVAEPERPLSKPYSPEIQTHWSVKRTTKWIGKRSVTPTSSKSIFPGSPKRMERRSNAVFSREFKLPENANVDDVKASMRDGVLTITVPKDETKKKHKKEVKIYEEDGEGVAPKGIGRFVCCKA